MIDDPTYPGRYRLAGGIIDPCCIDGCWHIAADRAFRPRPGGAIEAARFCSAHLASALSGSWTLHGPNDDTTPEAR